MSQGETLTLVAIDESERAKGAFLWYLDTVHKPEYRLLLAHCVEPLTVIGEVPNADLYQHMLDDSKSRAQRLEEKYAELLKARKLEGKIVAMFGTRPGETIVDTANKEKAAMIVMGTRGMGTVRRTLMGSVSDYVVHHAHCPVVVCRDVSSCHTGSIQD